MTLQASMSPDILRASAVLAGQRFTLYNEDSKTAAKVCPKFKKPKTKKDGGLLLCMHIPSEAVLIDPATSLRSHPRSDFMGPVACVPIFLCGVACD